MTQQVPIAAGLLSSLDTEPRLLASRCPECGITVFPRQSGCPRCSNERMEDIELGRTGKVWTWTTQAFRPKSPPYRGPETDADFTPFVLGYVELPGEVKVATRFVDVNAEDMRIGLDVELVVVPFRQDDDVETMTYAFRPVA